MHKIKYIENVREINGIMQPRYNYENIEDRFIRMYYGTIFLLAGASPCERDLMDFLVEEMNEENIVINHEITRDKFRKVMKDAALLQAKETGNEVKVKEYSDITIRKAFQTLKEKELLISVKKGAYIVNPKYFFKASEKERLDKIKISIEFQKGVRDPEMELITYTKNDN